MKNKVVSVMNFGLTIFFGMLYLSHLVKFHVLCGYIYSYFKILDLPFCGTFQRPNEWFNLFPKSTDLFAVLSRLEIL